MTAQIHIKEQTGNINDIKTAKIRRLVPVKTPTSGMFTQTNF